MKALKSLLVKGNYNKLTIPIILIIVIWVSSNLNWGNNRWEGIIKTDGNGYYAYLPAIFIYNDLNFGFFEEVSSDTTLSPNLKYDYRCIHNNNVINKYYIGTSIAQIPFFGLGHLFNFIFGFPLDGYSVFYLIFINIATIFYLFIALFFLKKILKTYYISKIHISIILIAIVFGTNVFHYTVSEPSMSHVYSFAFITMFIYFMRKYFISYKTPNLIISAALLGIVILIRPTNAIIFLIIPFVSGSFENLKKGIKAAIKNYKITIISFLIFIAIIAIQLIIYKIQTRNFWVYSYKGEGFNFTKPQIINILFSYRKGLFIYTPLLFVSLTGGYFLFKYSKYQFWFLFIFLFILTYLLSSWCQWYYGGSFSSRVYIEYYALFGILLGIAIKNIRDRFIQKFYIILILALILFCQIQTYQYRYAHIHWSEMNKEKYWKTFPGPNKIIKNIKEFLDKDVQ